MSASNRQHEISKLFEKIELYCGILMKCSSPEVGRWGEEDVHRAFHWADYFDKAIVRISKSRSVTAKVDGRLKELGETRGWRLGARELNYETFKQSSEYLTKALVDNPSLPCRLKEKVQSKIKTKSSSVVEPVREEKSGPSGVSCDPPPRTALALLKHIEKQRNFSGVCEQLELLSAKDENMELILNSVVERKSSNVDTKKAIVRWLIQHSSKHNCIWKQPPGVLAKISSLYLEFFKEQIKYLTNEVEKLETVNVKRTDESCTNETSSKTNLVRLVTTEPLASSSAKELEVIISHFKALCGVRSDVSEVTVWFVRTQALRHCAGASRFSYSTPLTTCAWTAVLYALREVAAYA